MDGWFSAFFFNHGSSIPLLFFLFQVNIADFEQAMGSAKFRNFLASWSLFTPWKINMEHKNGGLEDDFTFFNCCFKVPW